MQRELEKLEDLLSSGFIFREDYEARKVEIYSRYEQEADLSTSGGNVLLISAGDSEKEFDQRI